MNCFENVSSQSINTTTKQRMENTHVYYLPGLGTDHRVFEQLRIDATSVEFLPFQEPEVGESIRSYAGRMAENIKYNEGVVFVGLSFGGMLAQEIAAIRPVEKVVLVSTVKNSTEIPTFMKVARTIPLYKIPVPVSWRAGTVRFWGRAFGLKHATATMMFKDMMTQYSDLYYRWSTHQIVNWKGMEHERPMLHLHGDEDLVFPIKNIDGCIVINGGTHSMIYTHADIVSKYINEFIEQ